MAAIYRERGWGAGKREKIQEGGRQGGGANRKTAGRRDTVRGRKGWKTQLQKRSENGRKGGKSAGNRRRMILANSKK